jgi:hypothetical protein
MILFAEDPEIANRNMHSLFLGAPSNRKMVVTEIPVEPNVRTSGPAFMD